MSARRSSRSRPARAEREGSFFGPVISKAPRGPTRSKLWDAGRDAGHVRRRRAQAQPRAPGPTSRERPERPDPLRQGLGTSRTPEVRAVRGPVSLAGCSGRRSSGGHRYPRSARLNETLREIIADELVRIDDERLDVRHHHRDRRRQRAQPGRSSTSTRWRARTATSAILDVLERAPPAHPVVDQPPDPRQEDADPRLPARRGDPRRRAHRRHPARPIAHGADRRRDLTGGASSPGDRPRPRRGRQAGRDHQPRRRRHAAPAARGAPRRSRRHARPGRHRCARRRRRHRRPDCCASSRRPQAVHGRGRARRRDRQPRRRRRGRRHVRHAARDGRRRPAGRRRAPGRRHRADPADGVGDQGRRPSPARAGPRGHRGRAPAPARSPSTASTSTATADPAVLGIDVVCSAGTYVRTLAADLGHLLGGGAHLRNLRRMAVGPFTLDEAGVAGRLRAAGPDRGRPGDAAGRRRRGAGGADRQRPGPRRCPTAPVRGRCSAPTIGCSRSTSRSVTAKRSRPSSWRRRRTGPGDDSQVDGGTIPSRWKVVRDRFGPRRSEGGSSGRASGRSPGPARARETPPSQRVLDSARRLSSATQLGDSARSERGDPLG